MTLAHLDMTAVQYVCLNMRETDKADIYPLRPHDNPMILAGEIVGTIQALGRGRVAWYQGRPAAVVGFIQEWPGTWQVALIGTHEFRMVALDVLRWIRATMNELVDDYGARRFQCVSAEGNAGSHVFLRGVGAHVESRMIRYGKGGEPFLRWVMFAGVNDQFFRGKSHVLRSPGSQAADAGPGPAGSDPAPVAHADAG